MRLAAKRQRLQREGREASDRERGEGIRVRARQDRRPSDTDGSSLVVLWFQGAFGLPAEGIVMEQLRTLDWERLATDWSW